MDGRVFGHTNCIETCCFGLRILNTAVVGYLARMISRCHFVLFTLGIIFTNPLVKSESDGTPALSAAEL